jgi:spermidine/putrescine transport system permease protein
VAARRAEPVEISPPVERATRPPPRRAPVSWGRLRKRAVPYALLSPGGIWLALFFLVPIGYLAYTSMQSGFLGAYRFTWNLANFTSAARLYHDQFVRSLLYSGAASVAGIALTYPVAYWIAFRGGRRKTMFLFLLLLPFFVSFVIRTIQWQFLLSDEGIVLGPLKHLGVLSPDFRVLATAFAVVAGITYNFIPFAALPLYVALERIDGRLLDAASDLYAGRFAAFRKVVWPLSLPGVFAAFLLTFVPAFGDYVNAEFLGGPGNRMIGNVIQTEFLVNLNYPGAAAMAFLVMAALLAGVCLYVWFLGTERVGASGGIDLGVPTGDEDAPAPPRRWTRFVLPSYVAAFIAYLVSPILMMIVFGFNAPSGRFNLRWEGFTFDNYRNLFAIPGLTAALRLTLWLALWSTIISTIAGTLLGLAVGRYRFRGSGALSFVMFLAIASPEIVLGSSLLTMFVVLHLGAFRVPLGFWALLIAHVMFSISFVAVTIRARVQGLGRTLEESAQDLFAGPVTTFRTVTLPLLMPGVISGALLAFALSLDDFVISNFVSGSAQTFPLWVYGSSRLGIPPQVNVMGTLLFLGGVLAVALNVVLSRRRAVARGPAFGAG